MRIVFSREEVEELVGKKASALSGGMSVRVVTIRAREVLSAEGESELDGDLEFEAEMEPAPEPVDLTHRKDSLDRLAELADNAERFEALGRRCRCVRDGFRCISEIVDGTDYCATCRDHAPAVSQ